MWLKLCCLKVPYSIAVIVATVGWLNVVHVGVSCTDNSGMTSGMIQLFDAQSFVHVMLNHTCNYGQNPEQHQYLLAVHIATPSACNAFGQ